MTRIVLPLITLVLCLLSIGMDWMPPRIDSPVCRLGLCRSDQLIRDVRERDAGPQALGEMLIQDAASPEAWCSFAERQGLLGNTAKAVFAFDHARAAGPNLAPPWMRAANYDFGHQRRAQGVVLARRILSITGAFDQVLFSYLTAINQSTTTLLDTALPARADAALSWRQWAETNGDDRSLQETWSWFQEHRLANAAGAEGIVTALWNRRNYQAASQVWRNWRGEESGSKANLIENGNFSAAPAQVPMDWKLEGSTGVVIKRDDGLDIQFQGTENVTRVGLSQRVAILPGRYRLAAHLLAEDITTDEGVYWQVYDAENSIRLSVTGKPIRGTLDKSWMYLDFTAPRGTRAVEVAMYRRPSLRFDNKLGGRLHLFEVSLTRSSAGEE